MTLLSIIGQDYSSQVEFPSCSHRCSAPCYNQVFKVAEDLRGPNHGDCRVCVPHSDNRHCSGYTPFALHEFEVAETASPLA